MANNGILEKMNDIIEAGLNKLSQYDVGTDDYSNAVDDVAKLHKLRVEELKLEQSLQEIDKKYELEQRKLDEESTDKAERRKFDENYKNEQLKIEHRKIDDQIDRTVLENDKFTHEIEVSKAQKREKNIDRYISLGLTIAEITLPLAVYTYLCVLGFGREFDGVVTSDTLKRIWGNIKPTKK